MQITLLTNHSLSELAQTKHDHARHPTAITLSQTHQMARPQLHSPIFEDSTSMVGGGIGRGYDSVIVPLFCSVCVVCGGMRQRRFNTRGLLPLVNACCLVLTSIYHASAGRRHHRYVATLYSIRLDSKEYSQKFGLGILRRRLDKR